ncbi:MAG TPA: hypothetical protein VNI02_01185 [Blastocatellia bacterium]|nr:hypothetical protein [Blastocatellia bacterium]
MHELTLDIFRSMAVSGTYVRDTTPTRQIIFATRDYETVRLDVDGMFPQMMASGSYSPFVPSLRQPTHWIAHPLLQVDIGTWEGRILQVWGDERAIPHRRVRIHVPPGQFLARLTKMTITFMDGGPAVTRTLKFASPYFREVAFEFDAVEGSPRVTFINTCAHNERPSFLQCESLTFDEVYDRAGVDVSQSRRRSTVPLTLAGGDQAWQDAELHAAMRTFWSSYSDGPNWAVWTLFAGTGRKPSLFGSMFDDSDANQRQGVGVFNDAFDTFVPTGYPQRAEHIQRERFFALVHEAGHCFNLHHAWLDYNSVLQWPFFDDTSGVATFMQYPPKLFNFYAKFRYDFHDSELKWLRHAPEPFVQMGDARFYGGQDEFGREVDLAPWTLGIELHRSRGVFEFLEPVTLTATLTNTSLHPQIVDEAVLEDGDNFVLLIAQDERGAARLWRPFVQHCFLATPRVLEPGGSVKATFFVSAGLDGWYLAEPGGYTLQAVLRTPEFIIAAEPRRIRIAHSCSWDEEVVAQDLFTKDVARAFAFGASHGIMAPVETLRGVVDQLPQRAVSRHAALALAQPWMRDSRVLRAGEENRGFDLVGANPEEVRRLYDRALLDDPDGAARCFGTTRYEDLFRAYSAWLRENGAASD